MHRYIMVYQFNSNRKSSKYIFGIEQGHTLSHYEYCINSKKNGGFVEFNFITNYLGIK